MSAEVQKADRAFVERLLKAFAREGLSRDAVQVQFGLSKPTLARWETGTTLPHPVMRQHVIAWLDARPAPTSSSE